MVTILCCEWCWRYISSSLPCSRPIAPHCFRLTEFIRLSILSVFSAIRIFANKIIIMKFDRAHMHGEMNFRFSIDGSC